MKIEYQEVSGKPYEPKKGEVFKVEGYPEFYIVGQEWSGSTCYYINLKTGQMCWDTAARHNCRLPVGRKIPMLNAAVIFREY